MKNSIFNKKSLNLIKELTIAEFKLRDQGSLLGFFWTLLHPLLIFFVLYFLFSKWTGRFVGGFKGYLLIGIIQWNFFAGSTAYATDVLVRRRDIVKNLNFPKEILVVSSILTGLISHIFEFLVLFIFLFFIGERFTVQIFILPLIILVQLTLILSISLLISALYIYYRDLLRIWQILLMLGFFVTPIFYSLSMLSGKMQRLLLFNPLTIIIASTRAILIGTAAVPIFNLIIVFLVSFAFLIISYAIFKRLSKWFSEAI